jgi:predicted RNA-binding protein with PIN domain
MSRVADMAATLRVAHYGTLTAVARWLVDGNNVMGSRPDGWWRDRAGAMQRLVAELDARAAATGDDIEVVFDGRERDLQATHVRVAFAPHADDLIAARAAPGVTVVTSDRELRARAIAAGADVVGARALA